AEMPDLVARAKAAGMTVSVDCSFDAEVLARPDLVALLRGVDVFLPNRAEATELARHAPLADHAPLVVIKDGAQGATAICGETRLSRPAVARHVVDTVGAGDAFNAGFLEAWLETAGSGTTGLMGDKLGDCLDAGAAIAAVALARSGGARGLTRLRPGLHAPQVGNGRHQAYP
ncbi:MAG: PfkB family carbohydrate kinase, partial [Paracoccaceae bacterium]|nr:PfkB family carbohydrate kinase [Paracoccaceae bacterium]